MRNIVLATAAGLLLSTSAFAAQATAPASTPAPAPAAAATTAVKTEAAKAAKPAVDHAATLAARIKKAQVKLKDLGKYSGPTDGKTNADFETALKQFQKDNNLKETGHLNLETVKALNAAKAPK